MALILPKTLAFIRPLTWGLVRSEGLVLSGLLWDDFEGDLSKWTPYNGNSAIDSGALRIQTASAYTGVDALVTLIPGDYRVTFDVTDVTTGLLTHRIYDGTTTGDTELLEIDVIGQAGTGALSGTFTVATGGSKLVRIQRRSGSTDVSIDNYQLQLVALPAAPEVSLSFLTQRTEANVWFPTHSALQDSDGNEAPRFTGVAANAMGHTLQGAGLFGQVSTHLSGGIPPLVGFSWNPEVTSPYSPENLAGWQAAGWDGFTIVPDNFDAYLTTAAATWVANGEPYWDDILVDHPTCDFFYLNQLPEMSNFVSTDFPPVATAPELAAYRAECEGVWATWNAAVVADLEATYPSNKIVHMNVVGLFWYLYDNTDFGLLGTDDMFDDASPHGHHVNHTWYFILGVILYCYMFGQLCPRVADMTLPAELHASVAADWDDIAQAIDDFIEAQYGAPAVDGWTVTGGENQVTITEVPSVTAPVVTSTGDNELTFTG